ncbi:unnamed protein product [[Candida] boidinii]|uniref:Unnamed protein product n=1 Tax=Candida boidinii TaxID=5477 RepID=A0ACB5TSJ4_CANBO|nr:unnamed protein product [[Candida] boidinii]
MKPRWLVLAQHSTSAVSGRSSSRFGGNPRACPCAWSTGNAWMHKEARASGRGLLPTNCSVCPAARALDVEDCGEGSAGVGGTIRRYTAASTDAVNAVDAAAAAAAAAAADGEEQEVELSRISSYSVKALQVG